MLAVLSETDFCKVPTLYDIPNCFKLHSRLFGMDPSVSVIIDPINISLSTLLCLIVVQSNYPGLLFFSQSGYYFVRILFRSHTIWSPMCYLFIHFNSDIPQKFHNIASNDRFNLTLVPPFAYFYSIILA